MPILIPSSPPFVLQVGGQTLDTNNNNLVRSIVVEDHVDMAGFCSIMLDADPEQKEFPVEIGEPVDVKLKTDSLSVFKGEIISVDHSFQEKGTSTKIVRCIDHVHRLGRGRKTRFWNDKKDSDVAEEVASESGLSVRCDATDDVHPYIIQRNESNVAFLKRLAARNNFQMRVDQEELLFVEASFNGQEVELKNGEDVIALNMGYNSSNMVQKVVVQGWSVKDKKEVIGQCAASEVTKIGGGALGK